MLWALIMAGGWGTRLWPLSSPKMPKPFLRLIPGRKTLLEETIERLSPLIQPSRILIIGNYEHMARLRKCAPNIPKSQIIGEPVSRNTAPTVGLGASLIFERDPKAFVLVLPADHWIGNKTRFHQAVRMAARMSNGNESFSVFGIRPTFPSSSYGYLRAGKKVSGEVYQMKQFVEKPSSKRAKRFLATGRYFWHAGIFIASAANIIASLIVSAPRVGRLLSKFTVRNGKVSPERTFRRLPNISFDYAVLERLSRAWLIPCDFDWCDVGTWKSLEGLWPKDKFGNACWGRHIAVDSRRNVVYSKERLICLHGVESLAVIDTPGTLFVGRKDSAEEMRRVARPLNR